MKSMFLHVGGADYSALDFEKSYDAQKFYEQMVNEGVMQKNINEDLFYAEIKILEFGEIDNKFLDYVFNNLVDYEESKHTRLYKVKGN